MADIHNNRPTKRGFSFPGDDACRRSVTSGYTDENQEEEEMPPVKKMRHQPKEATDVVNELFSPESIHSPGPLGLNLTKSPSLLELIQKKLALATKGKRKQATENVGCRTVEGMKPSQKLQPSNFQASILRIGDWEWRSKHQGDLVAKFYFAKSKVVWEILYEGLKSKIEIKCSEISALRISCPKDLPGTLDIMVSVEPQFFRESSPRPYKSTLWHSTTDFTGGQARNFRHALQCDPGIMDKHIANLLSGDRRLYLLSQENNINPESPFPGTCCSMTEIPSSWSDGDSYGSDDDNLFGTEQTGESFPLHPMQMGITAVGVSHSGALQRALSPSSEEPSGESDQLKGNKLNWKKFFETTAVVHQPSTSNCGIMNGKGNHTNNLVNSENSHSRLNYSSPPPEVIWTFPGDSMTNPHVEPRSQSSYADHAVLYPSSEEPTALRGAPLKKDVLNWRSIFETRPVSNAGIMNNDSLINSQDLSRGAAPTIMMPGEMTAWRVPDDSWTKTNQQVNLWNQPSYNYKHGPSNQNMMEQGVSQRDLSGSQGQASLQQNLPRNGNLSPDRIALEQISQNLLSDDEVVDALGEENVLSAVNSLFCLIGQAPAPLSLSSHSQASNTLPAPPPPPPAAAVEPTEVINVDTPESSRVKSPGWSWELSPEDAALLSELVP